MTDPLLHPGPASRPIVHWSVDERKNAIYRKMLAGRDAPIGFTNVGVRPGQSDVSDDLLSLAEASGNRRQQGSLGRKLKRVFLAWQYNWCKHYLKDKGDVFLVVWNGIKGHRRLLADAARSMDHATAYFELAPLPDRFVVDFSGVNFGNSLPRRADFYTAWLAKSGAPGENWRELRQDIVPRASEKNAGVAQEDASEDLANENFIFVPLQVPGDSQITIYGDWITSVDQLIDTVHAASAHLPEGWHVRIKEHPSAGKSFSEKLGGLSGDKFRVDNTSNTMQQVAAARAVLTINSSVGLEAFFYDKPVIVLGKAFYQFGALSTRAASAQDLANLLSTPEKLGFSAGERDAFMAYLANEYFPKESVTLEGGYTLEDAIARDQRRDALLDSLKNTDTTVS